MEGGIAIFLLLVAAIVVGLLLFGGYIGGWIGGALSEEGTRRRGRRRPEHNKVEDPANERFVGTDKR